MAQTYLGVIALSTLLMAIAQLATLVFVVFWMKHISERVDQVEHATRPLLDEVQAMTRETTHAVHAARVRVERAGDAVAELLDRSVDTLGSVQLLVGRPARQGAALVAGARAMVHSLRNRAA
jgi:hypothetical protein